MMAGRHKSWKRFNTVLIIAAVWIVVALAIAVAVLSGSRKQTIPISSTIAYEERPDRTVSHAALPPVDKPAAEKASVPVSSDKTYAIFGTVTDAETGAPVDDAVIEVFRVMTDDDQERLRGLEAQAHESKRSEDLDAALELEHAFTKGERADSKKDGSYELTALQPGPHVVSVVHHEAYRAAEGITVEVSDKHPRQRVDFKLSRGATISGRVITSSSRTGIAGIKVLSYSESKNYSQHVAETNENGEFRMTGLEPFEYTVSLDLHNQPYHIRDREPSKRVRIPSENAMVTGVEFVLDAAGIVWGYVLDYDGYSIENADVILCTQASIVSQMVEMFSAQRPPTGAHAKKDGYYEIIGVPLNEEWQLLAMSNAYAAELSDPFVLTETLNSIRVDIYLSPGTTVFGRVVDTNGVSIPNASIMCLPGYGELLTPLDRPKAFRDVRADSNGTFVVPNLPAGEYQLLAEQTGYKFAVMGEPIYPDGFNDLRGVELVLSPIDEGQFSVYGYVVDPQGAAIIGAQVSLAGVAGEYVAAMETDTQTDANGYFEFRGIEPGFLMLSANHNDYAANVADQVLYDAPVIITLEPYAQVSGHVFVRETGEPATNAQVSAFPNDAGREGMGLLGALGSIEGGAHVGSSGEFSLRLPAGSYTLRAFAPDTTPGETDIAVSSGDAISDITLYVSVGGGIISGAVVTVENYIGAGATVWLSSANGDIFSDASFNLGNSFGSRTRADADGGFEFTHVPEGSYSVVAELQGYAQGRSRTISISGNQEITNVRVVVGHGGSLQGYVLSKGEAQSGAVVSVLGNGVTLMGATDANGQYRIDGIAPGTYLASAALVSQGSMADLFAPQHARVQIEDGQTTYHDFGNDSGGTVKGMCSPPPSTGTVGLAVLRVPGAPTAITGLDLLNQSGWFDNPSQGGAFIMGVSRIGPDGSFEIPGVPDGSFELSIVYLDMGQLMTGRSETFYETRVAISGNNTVELDISID